MIFRQPKTPDKDKYMENSGSANETLELACFQIIAHAGTARSKYIMAVDKAEQGDFEEAEKLMAEGEEEYIISYRAHSDIILLEESGKLRDANLLIVHSEDQMMSAETFKIMAEKFIALYRKQTLQAV